MTRSKNDNVITKLNLHQSAFSADFFNGDIQIPETSLQALVPFFPPPPPPPTKTQTPSPRACSQAITAVAGINVEELVIDLFHWFEKITKRKGVLVEYTEFCHQEYAKVLKHTSTRWLSLECVECTLEKYAGLKLYFCSESFADAKFKRLHRAFENPLTEVLTYKPLFASKAPRLTKGAHNNTHLSFFFLNQAHTQNN